MGAKHAEQRTLADSRFGSGSPAVWYIGISTTVSSPDGTGFTEPVGGSYARVAVTNNATNWPAAVTASGRTTKKNGTPATFANPTGSWGKIAEWGAFLTSTGGTPVYSNAVNDEILPRAGLSPVEFAAQTLEMVWA